MCKVWVPRAIDIPPSGLLHLRRLIEKDLQGLLVCGTCLAEDMGLDLPLGSDAFCSSWLMNKAIGIEELLRRIIYIPTALADPHPKLQAAHRCCASSTHTLVGSRRAFVDPACCYNASFGLTYCTKNRPYQHSAADPD